MSVTPVQIDDPHDVTFKSKGPKGGVGAGGAPATGGGRVLVRIALLIIVAAWMIPVIGLLISSFRAEGAVSNTGWWTVLAHPFSDWTLQNYRDVLSGGMGRAFLNTLVVTIPATVFPIAAAAFAAYAFSWMQFRGREVIFVIFVALLVVPLQVAFIPLFGIFRDLGLNGEFIAVWLAHTGFGMPLAVYLFRNYMGSLPREVIESANIDGASHFQIFWRLVIPLSVPALAAYTIFQFLWVWNDLLVSLVFLGGQAEREVVTLNLQSLLGSQGQAWHLLTAGAFITMTVPMIVFFSLQRFFVRGLTAGSVKG